MILGKIKVFLLLTLTLFSWSGRAQEKMLEQEQGIYFVTDHPFFNDEFIAKNKIKRIKAFISTKKNADVIRKKPQKRYYEFYPTGLLKSNTYVYYLKYGNALDSSKINYFYWNKELIRKEFSSKKSQYVYFYSHEDHIFSTSLYRTTTSGDKNLISDNKFRLNSKNRFLIHREFLSPSFQVYKRITHQLSGNYKLLSVKINHLIRKEISEISFTYNKGLLINKFDRGVKIHTEWKYTYDNKRRLMAIYKHVNGELTKEWQIIYDDMNKIKALVIGDKKNDQIQIAKFSYEYYSTDFYQKKNRDAVVK